MSVQDHDCSDHMAALFANILLSDACSVFLIASSFVLINSRAGEAVFCFLNRIELFKSRDYLAGM